jgi:uncharacterized membrane protein YdjX (TVP38/TMEM64 family)
VNERMSRLWSSLRRFGPAVLIGLCVVAAFASGLTRHLSLHELRDRRDVLQGLVRLHPVLSVAAYVGVYAVVIALCLPAAMVMTITGGFLFGPWIGGAAAAIGCTLGGVIVFLVCRTAAGDVLRRRAGPQVARIEDEVRRDAFFYIVSLRLFPIMPYWLATLALGFIELPLATYVIASFVGILPVSFVFAGLGSSLDRIFATGGHVNFHLVAQPQIFLPLLGLAVLSIIPVVVRRYRRGA